MTAKGLIRTVFVVLIAFTTLSCSDTEKKTVVCWGDSLTAPQTDGSILGTIAKFFEGDYSYPTVLADLLGDDYDIINCGARGEKTLTIAARQGSIPMFLTRDVILPPEGHAEIVENFYLRPFRSTWDSTRVTPFFHCYEKGHKPDHLNPCTIQGVACTIEVEGEYNEMENDDRYFRRTYIIKRCQETEGYDTLKAGAIVHTKASSTLRSPYANIFFMGYNGGYKEVEELIAQYRKMIAYGNTRRYLIIGIHKSNKSTSTLDKMKAMEEKMQKAFGRHYINLRAYMVSNGLKDARLTPTPEDQEAILHGEVPPQLLTDGTHFTPEGYRLIAEIIHKRFQELKY